jgi:hypothetical protein
MDVLVLGFWIVIMVILMIVGLGFKWMLSLLLAGIAGVTLILEIAAEGQLTYVSGSTTVSVYYGGYTLLPILFLTLLNFIGVAVVWQGWRGGG